MKTYELHVSSENAIKLRAFENAFKRFGFEVTCMGHAVATGVNEEPMSVEETMAGVKNRQKALKELVSNKTAVFCSSESGLVPKPGLKGTFGFEAIMLSYGENEVIATDFGIRYPESMLARIPNEYADAGVLVQKEYGIKEKDPVLYLSDGHVKREELIERAIVFAVLELKDVL
jgi:non-canonical (house-cleaning) NTP pyrophosphatase